MDGIGGSTAAPFSTSVLEARSAASVEESFGIGHIGDGMLPGVKAHADIGSDVPPSHPPTVLVRTITLHQLRTSLQLTTSTADACILFRMDPVDRRMAGGTRGEWSMCGVGLEFTLALLR
jgi:hypothetical protein